jgi:dTMP kinase
MSHPGRFVVLEGPEGAGKSTLAAGLAGRLAESGEPPVLVREPGGTPVAEAIRTALLDPARSHDGALELLYFATARADLVSRVIRPAIAAGRLVISDRFTLSTEAYQIGGRGVAADLVRQVNAIATAGLSPDLTIVLDLDPVVGAARQAAAGKRPDRMEREGADFHRRVAAWYRAATGPGIRHLDAGQAPSELLEAAWAVVRELAHETTRVSRG